MSVDRIFPELERQLDQYLALHRQELRHIVDILQTIADEVKQLQLDGEPQFEELDENEQAILVLPKGKTTSQRVVYFVENMIQGCELSMYREREWIHVNQLQSKGFYQLLKFVSPCRTTRCDVCGDPGWLLEMSCGDPEHDRCYACVLRDFEVNVGDFDQSLPRCCGQRVFFYPVVPWIDRPSAKRLLVRIIERTADDPIYCRHCSAFLTTAKLFEGKTDVITCHKCSGHTCVPCREVAHKGDCLEDSSAKALDIVASEQGWQRCFGCRHLLERREGCNHAYCPCGREFCFVCGARWNTCDCPLFSDDALADRPDRDDDEPAQYLPENFDWADVNPIYARLRPWVNLCLLVLQSRRRNAVAHPTIICRLPARNVEVYDCSVCGTEQPTFVAECAEPDCDWHGCNGCLKSGQVQHHDIMADRNWEASLGPVVMTDFTRELSLDLGGCLLSNLERELIPTRHRIGEADMEASHDQCTAVPSEEHLYVISDERHECGHCGEERRVRLFCQLCGFSTCVRCDIKVVVPEQKNRKLMLIDKSVEERVEMGCI